MNLAMIASRVGTRPLGLVLWLLAILAVSACQADFEVLITVEEDGSGVVETTTILDAEASAAILDLDLDEAGLPLTDLVRSGWEVERPERGADGSTIVTARKAFGTTSQFSEVMSELTGGDGAIRNFRLDRVKRFARVDYQVTGTIDTTDGLDGFGDSALTESLDRSLVDIAERYGADESDVRLEVETVLPGDIQGEPPPGAIEVDGDESRASWATSLGDSKITTVELASTTRQVSALVLRGVAVVLGVLAGVVVLAQVLHILLPDRRRKSSRRRSSPQRRASPPPPTADRERGDTELVLSDSPVGRTHRVVALDGLGVLYRRGEDLSSVLIPFARERASVAADEAIEAKARQLELGRITTGEFWASIGVDGEAGVIDAEYLAQLHLSPGVIRSLRRLRDGGIRVACITNDAAEWASRLKAGHSLAGLIDPWVISGSVGVRKPDPSIFEVLRRVTGEPPEAILIVDDDLTVLDAARELGFATAWFTADGSSETARDHAIIRNFNNVAQQLTPAKSAS